MNIQEFSDNLAIHGSNLDRWPKGLQGEAEKICKELPEAKEMLLQEEAFMALLEKGKAHDPNPGFVGRMISLAQEGEPVDIFDSLRSLVDAFIPKPAYVLAGVLFFGLAFGYAMPQPPLEKGTTVVAELETLYFDQGYLYE